MSPIQFKGVMVSCTFTNLIDHRAALIRAINSQSLKAITMENDSAKPAGDVIDSSLHMVSESSAYVGVISHKYGQIPECPVRNPERLSLTELEFNEARRLKLPVLLFIMGAEHEVKPRYVENDKEKLDKLKKFRENAKRLKANSPIHRIYMVFNNLHEFEVAVTQSVSELRRFLEENDRPQRSSTQTEVMGATESQTPQVTAVAYDMMPVSEGSIGDLDEVRLITLLSSPLAHDLNRNIIDTYEDKGFANLACLENLGCIIDGKPTVGACLCLGKQGYRFSKHGDCKLQMTNHNAPKRGGPKVALKLSSSNLLSLYEDGMEWLTSGMVLRRERTVGVAESEDTEIPRIMLHEALVNALVHRDYERVDLREQPTRIDVYSDRVDITSYGALPNGISIEKLNAPDDTLRPFRRNPVIAQIFQCFGRAELNASGVERMQLIADAKKLRPPLFQSGSHYVSIKLFRPSTKAAIFVSSVQKEFYMERQDIARLLRNDPILRQHFEPFLFEELPANDQSIETTYLSVVDR